MRFTDKLFEGDKLCYDIPVSEQKAYLTRLGFAMNDYERSFKQYKGQMFYMSFKKRLLLNIVSIAIGPFLTLYYVINGFFLRPIKGIEVVSRVKEWEKIIPDALSNKYQIDLTLWGTRGGIRPSDIGFVVNLVFRYGFHPYFVLKILFKVAKYSALICKYKPTGILVCDEFSFTSSVMTHFCERYGVKHINVQHGEKLFDLRDSYFRFHKCYIWDEHYYKLFVSLYAEPTQFEIAIPPSMHFDTNEYFDTSYYADYKYYLGEYNEEEIRSVVQSMMCLQKDGKIVKFRPHPHYSDISLLKKYVKEDNIEMPSVPIAVSVASTKYAVGVDSTVLVQAYFNHIEVILDDVTYKNRTDMLGELDYILSNKVNNRLSALQ